jgi:hypothetical protein
MVVSTATASQPPGVHRARFSWHFHTPGRRRWLLVQFVSAPHDIDFEEEQAVHPEAVPHAEPSSYASLLDRYTGEIWRRRSF